MSRVKQLADAEADAAEREDDENTTADDTPAPADDVPDLGPDDDTLEPPSMEEAFKMLERERERHRVALETIMGDDFQQGVPCDVCAELGYRFLGEMPYDPTLTQCETCHGFGLVRTHSRHEQHAVRDCINCQGQGFRVKTDPPPQAATPPPPPLPMFDPYTGQPLSPGTAAVADNGTGWAPGFTPPARPMPDAATPRY